MSRKRIWTPTDSVHFCPACGKSHHVTADCDAAPLATPLAPVCEKCGFRCGGGCGVRVTVLPPGAVLDESDRTQLLPRKHRRKPWRLMP